MSENQATVRYSFRLRLGSLAETRLLLEWNCARYVWNRCVELGNEVVCCFEYAFPDAFQCAHSFVAPTRFSASATLLAMRTRPLQKV